MDLPIRELNTEDLIRLALKLRESTEKIFQPSTAPSLLAPSPASSSIELFPSGSASSPLFFYGPCAPLRNNSLFGCSVPQIHGRATRIGLDVKTYDQGFGFSLKVFFGN